MNDKVNWDNSTPGKFLLQLADTISETYNTYTRVIEYENGAAKLIVANNESGIEIVLTKEDVIIYFDEDSEETIQATIGENTTYSMAINCCLSTNECLLNPLATTITDAIITTTIES